MQQPIITLPNYHIITFANFIFQPKICPLRLFLPPPINRFIAFLRHEEKATDLLCCADPGGHIAGLLPLPALYQQLLLL
jgi:hypothetical protein